MMNHGVYLNDFSSADNVFGSFQVPEKDREGVTILVANYEIEGYDGSAFVLFVRNGKLYEVNGSHCSCYGLEDQWGPEEVLVEELAKRTQTNYRFHTVGPVLVEILELIELVGLERVGLVRQLTQ